MAQELTQVPTNEWNGDAEVELPSTVLSPTDADEAVDDRRNLLPVKLSSAPLSDAHPSQQLDS